MMQRIKRAADFLFWILIILLSPLIVAIVVGVGGCILVLYTIAFVGCTIVGDYLGIPPPGWLQNENTNTKRHSW